MRIKIKLICNPYVNIKNKLTAYRRYKKTFLKLFTIAVSKVI